MKRFGWLALIVVALSTSCMKWDYDELPESFNAPAEGLFILSEGNFQYGNSELSFYNPSDNLLTENIFYRANGMKLGDVAQSMTIYGGKGWIVVNNSHVVFAIDLDSFKETGRITNLTSPRYIHFISDEKAYVSQLWDNRIFVVNPSRYEITGYITVPGMAMESGSTEQMVQKGRYVYCTCWSYQNSIIKIDTLTDRVVDSLEVGIQPASLVLDANGKLWTITDGGYEGSPYGYETPALVRIDPSTFQIESRFPFRLGETPRGLHLNGSGDTIYWLNEGVWRMNIEAQRLPVQPILKSKDTKFYGLTVDPSCGDIYVADAIDYQQQGVVSRYSNSGELLDEFYVGVNPGAFCWKKRSDR